MLQHALPLVLALLSAGYAHRLPSSITPQTLTPRAVIDELNTLRANPAGYADILQERLQYYNGNSYAEPGKNPVRAVEGKKAVEETITILRSLKPLPTLEMAEDMNRAAQDHADEQEGTGEAGHLGRSGADFVERTDRYGQLTFPAGEAISYGPATPRDVIVALVVDDGVADRGHRHSLLDPDYRIAGVGAAPHPRFRVTCVIDLAAGYERRTEPR